ncbi:hypothetical protein DFH09DRAFT_1408911 [Mycena vulgaris]|nr:hypothetical protein DFH09DRAFT_1408911 [Mycena vulgaris]
METETAHIDLFRIWLARARRTPLSLSLYDSDVWWSPEPSHNSLLQTIVKLSPQWRKVELHHTDDLAALLLDGKFPLLEKLIVTVPGDFDLTPLSFRNAPKLRKVYIPFYRRFQHAGVPLQIPWHQITTLSIGDIQLSDYLTILHGTTHLVDGIFEVWNEHPPAHPISIPPLIHLQSLNVAGLERSDRKQVPMSVLDSLTAPALQSLTLRFFPHHPRAVGLDASPFLALVSRSSFTLNTLVLSFMPAAEIIIQCLKALPSLVHLRIQPLRASHVNILFPYLTGDPDFLPKLESLHMILGGGGVIKVRQVEAITVPVLIRFLRWRRAAGLRSFQLAHKIMAPVLDQAVNSNVGFRRLAAEGMSLYVGMYRPEVDWVVQAPRSRVPPTVV